MRCILVLIICLVLAGCGSGGKKVSKPARVHSMLAISADYTGYYTWLQNSNYQDIGEFGSSTQPTSDEIMALYPDLFNNGDSEMCCVRAETDYISDGDATYDIVITRF